MKISGRAGATNAGFPSTCWTEVLSLRKSESEDDRGRVWGQLCETYWFPLYAFARHRGMSSHDSEDSVQSFFTSVGSPDYFEKVDHDRGKLRTFILTGFTRHLKDLRVFASAQKRGGGVTPMSLDMDQAEEWLLMDRKSAEESGALVFEKHWAQNIMRTVIEVLRQQAAGNEESEKRFSVMSRFLNPATCADYTGRQAAEDLGMSPAACEKAIQRLRNHFRIAVREQVASTLENPTEDAIMEEMLQLQKSLVAE